MCCMIYTAYVYMYKKRSNNLVLYMHAVYMGFFYKSIDVYFVLLR